MVRKLLILQNAVSPPIRVRFQSNQGQKNALAKGFRFRKSKFQSDSDIRLLFWVLDSSQFRAKVVRKLLILQNAVSPPIRVRFQSNQGQKNALAKGFRFRKSKFQSDSDIRLLFWVLDSSQFRAKVVRKLLILQNAVSPPIRVRFQSNQDQKNALAKGFRFRKSKFQSDSDIRLLFWVLDSSQFRAKVVRKLLILQNAVSPPIRVRFQSNQGQKNALAKGFRFRKSKFQSDSDIRLLFWVLDSSQFRAKVVRKLLILQNAVSPPIRVRFQSNQGQKNALAKGVRFRKSKFQSDSDIRLLFWVLDSSQFRAKVVRKLLILQNAVSPPIRVRFQSNQDQKNALAKGFRFRKSKFQSDSDIRLLFWVLDSSQFRAKVVRKLLILQNAVSPPIRVRFQSNQGQKNALAKGFRFRKSKFQSDSDIRLLFWVLDSSQFRAKVVRKLLILQNAVSPPIRVRFQSNQGQKNALAKGFRFRKSKFQSDSDMFVFCFEFWIPPSLGRKWSGNSWFFKMPFLHQSESDFNLTRTRRML